METRRDRLSVKDLRAARPSALSVLVQDALVRPLGQLAPETLLDLLALSEGVEGVPRDLARDLDEFRGRVLREIADLPDGPPLADFLEELAGLPAERVPACLREQLGELGPRSPEARAAWTALLARLEGAEPEPVRLADEPAEPVVRTEPARPPRPRRTTGGRRRGALVDERREEWIREYVAGRLQNYPGTGIKEAVLVAGARHRAPWNDVTEAEVLAVLRRMKREGALRHSAGRWMLEVR